MATLPISQTHQTQLGDLKAARAGDLDVLTGLCSFVENKLKVIAANATDSQQVIALVAEIQSELGAVQNSVSGAANTANVSAKENPVAPATNPADPINEPGVVTDGHETANPPEAHL